MNSPKIIFVTGVSGAGKTTIANLIKEELENCNVHDIDEDGVPLSDFENKHNTTVNEVLNYSKDNMNKSDLDMLPVFKELEQWRGDRVRVLFRKAVQDLKSNISTIICGMSMPHDIRICEEFTPTLNIYYIFIDVSREHLLNHLTKRNWHQKLIEVNINLIDDYKKEVLAEERSYLIDNSNKSVESLAKEVKLIFNNEQK